MDRIEQRNRSRGMLWKVGKIGGSEKKRRCEWEDQNQGMEKRNAVNGKNRAKEQRKKRCRGWEAQNQGIERRKL